MRRRSLPSADYIRTRMRYRRLSVDAAVDGLKSIDRPPPPIVPVSLRGLTFPVTVTGKSVVMLPLTVAACTSVLGSAGRSRVMLPFTVGTSAFDPLRAAHRAADRSVHGRGIAVGRCREVRHAIDGPHARPGPRVRLPSTSPLTVRPMNRTPAGTRTVNSTVTSLFRTFMRPPFAGRALVRTRQSWLGYIAQIVMPSACSHDVEPDLCRIVPPPLHHGRDLHLRPTTGSP